MTMKWIRWDRRQWIGWGRHYEPSRGETIGVIVAQTYHDNIRLDEGDKNVLVFVSNQIAMVIEQKRIEPDAARARNSVTAVFSSMPGGYFPIDARW